MLFPLFFGSRLSKKGAELNLKWHAFGDALQENKLNIKDFDPDLLLQYCIVMGLQGEQLKNIINQAHVDGGHSYGWFAGDTSSSISSIAGGIADIAATGTAISASYGGDGGGGGAGGGGAGGGGGGGAG
jgi:uncharacterized membrane protein